MPNVPPDNVLKSLATKLKAVSPLNLLNVNCTITLKLRKLHWIEIRENRTYMDHINLFAAFCLRPLQILRSKVHTVGILSRSTHECW